MTQNPLQQFFRQPKIFIKLPSMGIYNKEDSITGSYDNIPVFGMTGMDEILLKTPDALFTGESSVRVIQSCCPNIKDAWDITNLDIDSVLIAIRIATYGNSMDVNHTCGNCNTENQYEIDLSKFLDYFSQCKYNSKLEIDGLVIKTRPLTYKKLTEFDLENFSLQKQLGKVYVMEDGDSDKRPLVTTVFELLAQLQNNIVIESIKHVETATGIVDDREFIKEWIDKADRSVFESVKLHIESNTKVWKTPGSEVKCDSCGTTAKITAELDYSNFFVNA